MSDRRVWIAQCLCGPNRHAIAALAGDFGGEATARRSLLRKLRERIATLLLTSAINPWCAICGAEEPTWHYEVGRTAFRTMEEAAPMLAQTAAGNALAGALFGSHGPTKPGRG